MTNPLMSDDVRSNKSSKKKEIKSILHYTRLKSNQFFIISRVSGAYLRGLPRGLHFKSCRGGKLLATCG